MDKVFGTSEQWLPFSAVSNLLANCQRTCYRHITDSQPTVLSRPTTDPKKQTSVDLTVGTYLLDPV